MESLKGRDHLEDLDIYERIKLKWILGKWGFGCGLDSSGSGEGLVVGSSEHCNELSGAIKGREFLHYLSILLATQGGLNSMEFVSPLESLLTDMFLPSLSHPQVHLTLYCLHKHLPVIRVNMLSLK
jgi:hypothetical protein